MAPIALAVALTGCRDGAGRKSEQTTEAVPLAHVHGLGVNPTDGRLYVATHHGVFRLDQQGRPEPAGASRQDTMGFTVVGPDRFLGSGHPGAGEGGPPHLGLIESTDAGRTWRTVSLRGEADFHALVAAHGRVYGWNSTTGQLVVSADNGTTWDRRATVRLLSLAVDPNDAEHLLATGADGLLRSRDGGRTWQAAVPEALGPALLAWDRTGGLWAARLDGTAFTSADGGRTWQQRAPLPGQPAALTVTADRLYAATVDAWVVRSDDQGRTWTPMYVPRN